MSYRKKHHPPKPPVRPAAPPVAEYTDNTVRRSLSTGVLNSGLPYQRPVKEKELKKFVEEWDDTLFDPPVVSFRDGKFNVVDGQHRIAALRAMNGGNEVIIPCKVYTGLTYEQEAELCYKLDQAKRRLTIAQSIKALVESATDAEILDVQKRVEDAGFIWALGRPKGEPFEIVATRAVINAYRFLGGAAFSRMLELMAKTWRGNPKSTKAAVISGMAKFLKTYETELKNELFIKRLAPIDPDEIIKRGKLDFSTDKSALRYARVSLEKYNRRQPESRKLPYRLMD